MKVPFNDLSRAHKPLREEILRTIGEVIDDGIFIGGERVSKFESNFAKFCRKEYCIGIGNGSDAIELALRAYGIGQGDEVIAPANTYNATVAAIVAAGATPVLVDCDDYFNINPELIHRAITQKTKAIVPVHLYGRTANMNPILDIANSFGLRTIEDCAQAHGATYLSNITPIGETGAFSFYPTKNLGALGDGGAVVTDNGEVAKRVRQLGNYGQREKNVHEIAGRNSRLDTIQAAVLDIKLRHLEDWNNQRKDTACKYHNFLSDIDIRGLIHSYACIEDVSHLYVIQAERRDELRGFLASRGVETAIHYPTPIHLQEAFKSLGYKKGDFPRAEQFSKEVLSLPMFPGITDREVNYVSEKIKEFYSRTAR